MLRYVDDSDAEFVDGVVGTSYLIADHRARNADGVVEQPSVNSTPPSEVGTPPGELAAPQGTTTPPAEAGLAGTNKNPFYRDPDFQVAPLPGHLYTPPTPLTPSAHRMPSFLRK